MNSCRPCVGISHAVPGGAADRFAHSAGPYSLISAVCPRARCQCGAVGVSWQASRQPLGGSFEASCGLLGAVWGPFGASFLPSWGLLGASWGLLKSLLAVSGVPLGAESSKCHFEFPLFGPFWAVLTASWAVLGPSWAVLEPSWAVFGPSWAVLGASWASLKPFWAVLGRSLEPLEPFWAVLGPKRREPEKQSKTIEKSMIFASWSPLGKPFGALLGCLGAPLDRLEAILGHLGQVLDSLGVSWTALGPSWSPLGPLLRVSWDVLGASWAVLGASEAVSGGGLAIKPVPPRLAPPLDPSLKGFAPPERHHSYLALSVTCLA